MKNWSYTIKEGEHAGETLWSGRYCAVCGVVWTRNDDGDILVLANKRGIGTPDFQGYWNLPCGYLEADETGKDGVRREIKEETGYDFNQYLFKLLLVQTDPTECNNANVTIFYSAYVSKPEKFAGEMSGGETNEVSDVQWISIDTLHKFNWAFKHDEILKRMFFKDLNRYGNP